MPSEECVNDGVKQEFLLSIAYPFTSSMLCDSVYDCACEITMVRRIIKCSPLYLRFCKIDVFQMRVKFAVSNVSFVKLGAPHNMLAITFERALEQC